MISFDSPVSDIKGIGAGREKYLKKLNITTAGDIVNHYPRDYEDRTRTTPIAELLHDEVSVIIASAKDIQQV